MTTGDSNSPAARRTDWFNRARYGLFIHWGPYSVAARGEWVMNRERIGMEEYVRLYADRFTADRYDPADWARLAREAGMGYVVLTTRHHDGFALWPTSARDFHAGRIGPGRDLLGPFIEAVRAAGLKVGLYYSVADWTHPDYPAAFARDWPTAWPSKAQRLRYLAYVRTQVRELLTRYGRIDLLWYDGCKPKPLDSGAINRMARELQPDILINRRLGPEEADLHICEQAIRPAAPGQAWEACMTLNGNWGHHAGDHDWMGPRDVARMLTECAAGAGNLLLNIGPRGDGSIPERSREVLREVGRWLARNPGWLADSDRSPFGWINHGRVTVKGDTLYLHLFNHPGPSLCYAEIANRVRSVRLLDGDRPLPFTQTDGRLIIDRLPDPLDPIAGVIAIQTEGPPAPITPQGTHWIPG